MKNIKFDLPIYADVLSIAKNGLNIKEAVINQLNQGDPAADDIVNELKERFEAYDDDIDYAIYTDWSDYIIPNEDSLIVDRDETFSLGFNECCNTVAFHVDCIFDVEKWVDIYKFEEIEEIDR